MTGIINPHVLTDREILEALDANLGAAMDFIAMMRIAHRKQDRLFQESCAAEDFMKKARVHIKTLAALMKG